MVRVNTKTENATQYLFRVVVGEEDYVNPQKNYRSAERIVRGFAKCMGNEWARIEYSLDGETWVPVQ